MPSFEDRVNEFLDTTRLGIDFGEVAGGLALVRGNAIIQSETYHEFRDATLEDRRGMRRGRRTRHSKKMRLARLRSWLLRQFIPQTIPGAEAVNGKHRLPDPYRLMAERKYQTLPGFYGVKGNSPRNAPTWMDEAKKGKVDAEGFVIALTHLFKKRGYKYYADDSFEAYNDANFIAFLNSCCMLAEDKELMKALQVEIDRRKEKKRSAKKKEGEAEDEKKNDLDAAFNAALYRPAEKKKALPRVIRERELEEVVRAFCKRWSLDCSERWARELTGLMNKFVRLARFENRVKSGCSWCGKNTPRLAKEDVRRLNLKAAVNNLKVRVDKQLRRDRKLEQAEKNVFLDWFENRVKERAGLYRFGSGKKTPLAERVPSRDNIEKYLEHIGAVKRWDPKKKKLKFPMLTQLDQLINGTESARGRAKLCIHCVEKAAQGMTMEEAGVESQSMRKRKAQNPKREQHDARVLKRIEEMLFHKGKTGPAAWKHGPVSFITIEAPKPRDPERAKKGEQKEKKTLSLRERLLLETGGMCIFCEEPLQPTPASTEIAHIYPKSKGGPNLQLNYVAACKKCNKEQDNRLPSEWFTGAAWEKFKGKVEKLSTIPEFKRILLSLSPGEKYPDDPTSLARTGARVNQFIMELQDLFRRYGVEPPSKDYQTGKPLVQQAGGDWTTRLRRSFQFKDVEGRVPNFPPKNRIDLFNHAQDAALLAATPPHTWRMRIFNTQAKRLCRKPDGQGEELRERPDVAMLELAPDWNGYFEIRKIPIVRPLGNLRITWKRKLMNTSYGQDPHQPDKKMFKIRETPEALLMEKLDAGADTLIVGKGGKHFKVGDTIGVTLDNGSTHICEISSILSIKDDGVKGGEWKFTVSQALSAPASRRNKVLCANKRTIERAKTTSLVLAVPHHDGTSALKVDNFRDKPLHRALKKGMREVELVNKVVSDSVIIWRMPDSEQGKITLSLCRSSALCKLLEVNSLPLIEPPLSPHAIKLREFHRGELIPLDGGFYRVKEFDNEQITIIPENAITDSLRSRLGLDKEQEKVKVEKRLGKTKLWEMFGPKTVQDAGD